MTIYKINVFKFIVWFRYIVLKNVWIVLYFAINIGLEAIPCRYIIKIGFVKFKLFMTSRFMDINDDSLLR